MFFGGAWIFGRWGVVGWGRKSYLGPAEIISLSSRSFSHLSQIWCKCETPFLFFRPQMFFKVGVRKNLANFGMQLYLKATPRRCFPVKLAKFLRTSFFKEHLWWLLTYCTHMTSHAIWVDVITDIMISIKKMNES